MKRLLFAVAAAALSLSAAVEFKITADRKMPIYKCGENASFTVTAVENGAPVKSGKYNVQFLLGGRSGLKTVAVDFAKANPARAQITLKEPGFVLVRLLNMKNKRISNGRKPVYAGAGFSPEKIRRGYQEPADFMKFWLDGRKKLADTPVKLTKCARHSNKFYTTYFVNIKSLDNETISGFLSVPNKKGKYPAYVTVPGAGPGVTGPGGYARVAITLSMNVHRYPTQDNAKAQRALYNADRKKGSYPIRGAGDRDKYFFRSVYVAVDRAINHVAAMPEWDGKHMVVDGSSQGGGSALILAGLNKNITALAANVPALCDHGGFKLKRAPGWPSLCNRPDPDKYAPYFDAAIFASYAKVPALVSCGFIDTTCPPASVYAAFNELKGEKTMINVPLEGHTTSKAYQKARSVFIRKHLGLGK